MYNFCAVPTPCDFVYIIPPNLFWCRYPLVCGYFVALLSGIFIDIGPCKKHFSESNQASSCLPRHLSYFDLKLPQVSWPCCSSWHFSFWYPENPMVRSSSKMTDGKVAKRLTSDCSRSKCREIRSAEKSCERTSRWMSEHEDNVMSHGSKNFRKRLRRFSLKNCYVKNIICCNQNYAP